nr:MAG TPA: hypothetical protein [Caudoviricetes sp.]
MGGKRRENSRVRSASCASIKMMSVRETDRMQR